MSAPVKAGLETDVMVAERFFAAIAKDDTGERWRESLQIPCQVFTDYEHRKLWAKITSAESYDDALREMLRFLANPTNGAEYLADREALVMAWAAREGAGGLSLAAQLLTSGNDRTYLKRALAAEVDPANPPPEDNPVFYVGGALSSTTGNLTALVGPAKSGKTAVIDAFVSSCLVADGYGNKEADTFRITSTPTNGKAVAVFDTEQSPHFSAKLFTRSHARVGLNISERPKNFRLFPLAGWSARELSSVLSPLLAHLSAEHGGIHAIFVDGGADFAVNVNDPEEAATLCAEWHALAIKHSCAIVIVVHSNEGAKADEIARGWLGKQLRRKAESNLQIKKTNDVAVIFSETGQRHAPIYEKDGPRFRWSDEAGMHVSCETVASSKDEAKREKLRDMAEAVMTHTGKSALRYSDFLRAIADVRRITASTAEDRFNDMKKLGVIGKNPISHEWQVNPVTP